MTLFSAEAAPKAVEQHHYRNQDSHDREHNDDDPNHPDKASPHAVGPVCDLDHLLGGVQSRLHMSQVGFGPGDRAIERGHGRSSRRVGSPATPDRASAPPGRL